MKILGYKRNDFEGSSGAKITGYNLYVTSYDLYGKDADGTACERVYLTDSKLNGYAPHVGDTVNITYNRNGKRRNPGPRNRRLTPAPVVRCPAYCG